MEQIERTPFGKRLFDAREAAGLTQAQVAQKVGMAQSTLAEAEISGKRSGYTAQLAELYGVSAKWLATGKGSNEQRPAKGSVLAAMLSSGVAACGAAAVIGSEINEDLISAVHIKPKTRHQDQIDNIVALLNQTSLEGLAAVLEHARLAAREYPLAKKTPKLSP